MARCKICGKESGSYEYCEECFQKIENGETAKCVLCGGLYIKGTRCKCTKINEPSENVNNENQSNETTNNNVYNNITQSKPKNSFTSAFGSSMGFGCGCVGFIILALIVLIIILTSL